MNLELAQRHGHEERGQLHSLLCEQINANALDQYHVRGAFCFRFFLDTLSCLLFALESIDADRYR